MRKEVKKVQWFDETSGVGARVRGQRVLVVDEVDDTRTTLQYCVEELLRTNSPAAVAVAVVHNKIKPKKGKLPDGVLYLAGADVPDRWNCYPWDAAAYGRDIAEHEKLARICAGEGELDAPPAAPKPARPAALPFVAVAIAAVGVTLAAVRLVGRK